MKWSLFILCFAVSGLLSYGLELSESKKNELKPPQFLSVLDQGSIKTEELSEKTSQSLATGETEKRNLSEAENQALDQKESDSSAQAITKKIKSVFEDFIKILENQSVESKEYRKAVNFLENSLYNEASFDSLKLLAQVYKDRKDFQNQMNVLNVLSVNYPANPDSFYLLAMGYKDMFLKLAEKELSKEVLKEREQYKKEAIKNLNQALKLDSKHVLSYTALLDLLMITDPKTDEKKHTRASLAVVLDMWKNLKQNKHYIPLCKAYYDNQFFQTEFKGLRSIG